MYWFLLFLAPAVAFALFGPVYPRSGPSPRWRLRVAGWREGLAARVRRHRSRPPDPFEALHVQMRLGILADEIRQLQDSHHVYAKAHRLKAIQAAYDDLLDEACRLAGVEIEATAERRSESERLREEVELAARGWSW